MKLTTLTLLDLLGLAFVILKLADAINWSWWLVLLPIYLEAVVAVGLLLLLCLWTAALKLCLVILRK